MARIAIVGMACVFPGAAGLDQYWRNIIEGVDAISDVPAHRWDASFYDPTSTAIDRFYCKRGGFVDAYASFDPLAFGVMPKAAEAADPDQLLTLRVGHEALKDAGYIDREFARERTGVIIGRGNYVTAGVLRLEQHVRLLPQLLQTLQDLMPTLPAQTLEAVRTRFRSELSYYGPDVAAGMIPNLIASRLANRLDLRGPAYTVDAACASSLLALEQASQSLARGDTDMMLVGGAHLTHDLTFWATFCQLGALSREGVVRPFAQNADGILAGEGVGMVVIKRLDDALAAGDRVYAVIEGVGSSSDGRSSSLVAPSVSGQRLALERAWAGLEFAPQDIGLVEAHGTGTPTGDEAELTTLAEFFGRFSGEGARPVVGSVKSMIGHTMPAAGMAGLIKSALSIYHGVLPPTLHCENPHPLLEQTRFRTIPTSEAWPMQRQERVAAVNAFGFGGINAHVVLRGAVEPVVAAVAEVPTLPEVFLLSAATPAALLQRLEAGERDRQPQATACRLVIIEPDEKKLALARKVVAAGKPWSGRHQVYFSPQGLLSAGGRMAFMFPGVDSSFAPQLGDLARYFKRALPAYCEAQDPGASLLGVVLGLLGCNRFLFEILGSLKLSADVMAGHSVGEWSAMLAAGMMDQGLSDRTNANLDFDAVKFPDVQFLAASCSEDFMAAAMADLSKIAISHDNCPHQVIACGQRDSIAQLAERLREAAVFHQVLPFVSGFHSPLFSEHMDWYREFFGQAELAEPVTPVWSATSCQRFPLAMADKRTLALDHLLQPVRFRELTEALYAEGVRVFVQVGTGSLTGFVDDTLSGRPHLAIAANVPARSGLAQLVSLCAALWVEGADFDTRLLAPAPKAEGVGASARATGHVLNLQLGVPLVRIREPLGADELPFGESRSISTFNGDDPVECLMRDTLMDIERAGQDVLALWQQHRGHTGPQTFGTIRQRLSRTLDIESTIPYVRDHELYPQRPGWPVVADRHPVVPMTMEVMLVREAVEELLPQAKVVEVRNIQAYNWLTVTEPRTVTIALNSVSDTVIDAEIEGFFKAQVVVAAQYPALDLPPFGQLINSRDTAVSARQLYSDHWMFHGPAYQGVADFAGIGDNGIDGDLRVSAGKGALLDNMGQLAGYWVMEQPENCLAMPIGVDRICFHGADPSVGEVLRNRVRVVELDRLNCVSNHVLSDAGGNVRISIHGWRTRRYQMDEPFWLASRQLHCALSSSLLMPHVTLFEDRYDTAIMRDYIAHRYLSAPERGVYEGLSPRRRRHWLNGRVAAKDAVRSFLRHCQGIHAIYPKELRIENDEAGAPRVHSNVTQVVPNQVTVSLAHKDHLAVAIACTQPVGVDIERIEPRDESFIELAFSPEERRILGGEEQSVAVTRGWVAKEVVAKARRTGLGGKLREFSIQECTGDCIKVSNHWVETRRLGDYIVGWTQPQQTIREKTAEEPGAIGVDHKESVASEI